MLNKKAVNIELPKFRYIDDASRVLSIIQADLKDTQQLIKLQYKKLSNIKAKVISSTDLELHIEKLNTLYLLSEDLYEKVRMLEAMLTQLTMQFDMQCTTSSYVNVIAKIHALKTKVKAELDETLAFISLASSNNTPKSYSVHAKSIFDLIKSEINNSQSTQSTYCLINEDSNLLISHYLHLKASINDLGDVVPNLYISLHAIPKTNQLYVNLNQEFEAPNKLTLTASIDYEDSKLAITKIHDLLSSEQFSTALNVKAANKNPVLFKEYVTYAEAIKSITVTSKLLTFKLHSAAIKSNVVHNIYKELTNLTRSTNHKVLMTSSNENINFSFQKCSTSLPINSYDLEFMRDKFKLSDSKIQKITSLFV